MYGALALVEFAAYVLVCMGAAVWLRVGVEMVRFVSDARRQFTR